MSEVLSLSLSLSRISNAIDDEVMYANMNFTGRGHAGQRWEDYQKTQTLLKGVEPHKKKYWHKTHS